MRGRAQIFLQILVEIQGHSFEAGAVIDRQADDWLVTLLHSQHQLGRINRLAIHVLAEGGRGQGPQGGQGHIRGTRGDQRDHTIGFHTDRSTRCLRLAEDVLDLRQRRGWHILLRFIDGDGGRAGIAGIGVGIKRQ